MLVWCRTREGSVLIPLLAVFSVSLGLCGSSAAALDPESTTPYQVKVVLRVAEHPLLTKVFKDQLQRELGDGLQGRSGAWDRSKSSTRIACLRRNGRPCGKMSRPEDCGRDWIDSLVKAQPTSRCTSSGWITSMASTRSRPGNTMV